MKEYESVVKQLVDAILNSENGDSDTLQKNLMDVLTNQVLPVVIAKKQLELLDEQIAEIRAAFNDGSLELPFVVNIDEKRIFGALVMLITDRYKEKDEQATEEDMDKNYIPSDPA